LPIDGLSNETGSTSSGWSSSTAPLLRAERAEAALEQFTRLSSSGTFFVVEKIQNVLRGAESELGGAKSLVATPAAALDDASVDGVVSLPPTAFAIDYLENDAFHLDFLEADVEQLRERMIGLRGRKLPEKYEPL